ncbi:MAG: phospholipid carrier-dependent glycosyltransferase [Chloroflexi bacterium]|nr:MAG: phospholipid carrier-dependent glycosyltransferase [Chloroflexota bacterium]
MEKSNSSPVRLSDTGILVLIGIGVALFHVITNGQYGFHRDELDFIMNARRLDWGYVSYPLVTPFLARIGLELFGESLRGLRIIPAIAQGIVVILAGLMARDMGGKRNAQIMAAFAVFITPISLQGGTLMMYFAFDFLWWVLVAFCLVRLLVTNDARYWLGIGAAIGLGMMTKYTMAFWVIGLIVAVLLTEARKYLRSKWLYLGAALALLIFLPNLIWQIQHDFVSLDYLSAIHARDIEWGRGEGFVIRQFYDVTNTFSLPLWTVGLSLCLFGASMKRFRALGWMFIITFALFLINQGRPYYTGPSYVMLLAAGAVGLENWLETRTERMRRVGSGLLWGMQVIGGLIFIIAIKPIAPINSPLWEVTSNLNREVVEMVGWQDLSAQVARIYQSIPDSEKPRTTILAGNYGEAGALDLYRDEYGLPPVITGANSMWYRGYGDPEPETVIVVGFERSQAGHFFKQCDSVGMVTNQYGVKNEETSHHTGLYICRQPQQPWNVMWRQMQWFQ